MNKNMLYAEIKLKGYSLQEFLTRINMNRSTWNKKVRGIHEFTRDEIVRIIEALNLSVEKTMEIFFCRKVS